MTGQHPTGSECHAILLSLVHEWVNPWLRKPIPAGAPCCKNAVMEIYRRPAPPAMSDEPLSQLLTSSPFRLQLREPRPASHATPRSGKIGIYQSILSGTSDGVSISQIA